MNEPLSEYNNLHVKVDESLNYIIIKGTENKQSFCVSPKGKVTEICNNVKSGKFWFEGTPLPAVFSVINVIDLTRENIINYNMLSYKSK